MGRPGPGQRRAPVFLRERLSCRRLFGRRTHRISAHRRLRVICQGLGYCKIVICTNGLRLSDRFFCLRLVRAGLTRVTISAHSHQPEVEDLLITRVPGALERKVRAVRNLVALREQGLLPDGISLNPVVCRPTLQGMEDFIRFFGKIGIGDVRFNYIWPHGDVQTDPSWIPSFREAIPHIMRVVLANEKRLHKHLSFGGIPKCALLLSGVSGRLMDYLDSKYLDEAGFDPANDVSMATRQGPMQDRFTWQQVKRDVLKVKGPHCGGCSHRNRCEGVWASYARLYGFLELRPL